MTRRIARLACLALALAGCGDALSRERRYTGALAGTCPPQPATLTRARDQFSFAPGDGALVLHGGVAPDGGFAAALNTQPPGKPPFILRVSGHAGDDTVTLHYTTPRCAADATLSRARGGLL